VLVKTLDPKIRKRKSLKSQVGIKGKGGGVLLQPAFDKVLVKITHAVETRRAAEGGKEKIMFYPKGLIKEAWNRKLTWHSWSARVEE